MSDAIDFFFEGQFVEARKRQGKEQADTAVQNDKGVEKSAFDLRGVACNGGGIGNAPMGGYGLSRPDGTDFASGVVTNSKDKIHLGCAGLSEFVPALASQIGSGKARCFELLEGEGIDAAGGKTACAVGDEIGLSILVENSLGHDGTGGVTRAEK